LCVGWVVVVVGDVRFFCCRVVCLVGGVCAVRGLVCCVCVVWVWFLYVDLVGGGGCCGG